MARPKLKISEDRVEELAQNGCSTEEVAAIISKEDLKLPSGKTVSHRSIERRFGPTLKRGKGMMRGQLRSMLLARAKAGDTAILIFLAKTVLGLREKESPDVQVNVNASAEANATAPNDQVKAELLDLHKAIQLEATRANGCN